MLAATLTPPGATTHFTWVKTADEILAKAVRKTQADSGARH
jgi:hypothetical protein